MSQVLRLFFLPTLLVRYKRNRFVENFSGARIVLDSCIQASHLLIPAHKFSFKQSLLEIKGEREELPQSLRPLVRVDIKRHAFSKYYIGYCEIYGYGM